MGKVKGEGRGRVDNGQRGALESLEYLGGADRSPQ